MSGQQRIQGVGTSTAALVSRAQQGPTNQAVLVTGPVEYEQTFGGPQAGDDLFLGVRLNGVVNIEVGFAPLRPAEFVTFRLRHTWH